MAINIVEDIIPVTKVREQIGSVIERARETKRPIVVTQNGSAAVVIIGDFPELGRLTPEAPDEDVRQLVVLP